MTNQTGNIIYKKIILKMNKIIVTGGCGFIGSNLIIKLVEKYPEIEIIVIDNLWKGEKKYIENIPNVSIIIGDLRDNKFCIEHIKDVECVYHLADIVPNVSYAYNNEFEVFRNNILINSNVLNAVCENKIKKYIYTGTACSYTKDIQMKKHKYNYVSEEDIHPINTDTSYGMSKYLGEYEAELAHKKYNFELGIIRFHNVYGPMCYVGGLDKMQVIPSIIYKVINQKEDLVVWGDGSQYRDFIYIDDVIEALISLYFVGMNTGAIQVGSGVATTIKYVAEKVNSFNDNKLKINYDISKHVGDYGRISINKKASIMLNWNPRTSIDDGIRKTYDWIKSCREI